MDLREKRKEGDKGEDKDCRKERVSKAVDDVESN